MTKRQKNSVNQRRFPFMPGPDVKTVLTLFKQALTTALKETSRIALAEFLTEIYDKKVTVATIDNWTAESKPHYPPVHLVLPICIFCGDFSPLKALLKPYGLRAINKKEEMLLKHGELSVREEKIKAQKTRLNADLLLGGGRS